MVGEVSTSTGKRKTFDIGLVKTLRCYVANMIMRNGVSMFFKKSSILVDMIRL